MLIDANLLIYAVDERSPYHASAQVWLERVLNGDQRVGLPWQTIGAFLRIMTHPRVTADPLTPMQAVDAVNAWLGAEAVWIPAASARTVAILADLINRHHITGNLVPDAQLAALAVEYGLEVYSADTGFARFREVRWVNPLG